MSQKNNVSPISGDKKKVIPLMPVSEVSQQQSLYEAHKKIYPRSVKGPFANWRIFFVFFTQALFYGTAWLEWNGRQAVLFDLAQRKFYILGLVFWPQDFIYLTLLLVISAFSLFLFTAVAGRLFCGYACPQTVYTEIFLWIEEFFEGNHSQRIKLDQESLSRKKFIKKFQKHLVWGLFALWTGTTFVGYFTPIRELVTDISNLHLSGWQTFWIVFYSFATYGNAGWMREQVCKYMCPYARFQSVMFDRDTLIITYDEERGEPRGSRSRKTESSSVGLGDCIDCKVCVQVCPTGIDIREGLQYECIGCAACIDGCDEVMDKMSYPRGLIRYATENALEKKHTWIEMIRKIFRPRILIYTALVWAVIIASVVAIQARTPVKADIIRDRVVRQVNDQYVQNVYQVRVMNTDEVSHNFDIRVTGLDNLTIINKKEHYSIGATTSTIVSLRLQANAAESEQGSRKIYFTIEALDDNFRPDPDIFLIKEKSVFIVPKH